MSHRLHLTVRAVIALALVALVAACSSDASTRGASTDGGPTTTAPSVTVPTAIPEGTTLRVGDQLDYLKTVLAISGQDQDFDYEVEYSAFVGGPPMLQAFQGGSLDTGFIGSTPLIFAQAADQDLVAVAGWASQRGLQGLVSVDPSIEGWGDLEGKRVAYQRGTASEAALLQGLAAAGVDPGEVTTVDVPLIQVNAALEGGSADAGVSTEPLISLFLAGDPDATVAATADEVTDRSSFLIASGSALDDEGKTAALADYAARLVRAFRYLNDNPEELAEAVFVQQYGLPIERATEIVESGNGTTAFFSLPGEVLDAQQALADLFFDADQIPAPLDVTAQFDTRFNDLIEEVQAE